VAEDTTIAQYRALALLASRGPQRMVDLAAALGITPPTAGRMCDRLRPPTSGQPLCHIPAPASVIAVTNYARRWHDLTEAVPVRCSPQARQEGTIMLGRKNYTQEEIDQGKAAIRQQLTAYNELVKAVNNAVTDHEKIGSAFEVFDSQFFNNLALVLDRYFAHRFAGPDYEGKDGNPLNEVRIITDSIMNNKGIMRADKQIKLPPEKSVVKLSVGDKINLTQAQFESLAGAFFEELERRFL
jgi:hypothetical protein